MLVLRRIEQLPGSPDMPTKFYNQHRSLAAWTLESRPLAWCKFLNNDVEDQLDKREQFLCIAVQEPIVPHSPKPFRQHMLHYELQKFFAWECAGFYLASLALNVRVCNLPIMT